MVICVAIQETVQGLFPFFILLLCEEVSLL